MRLAHLTDTRPYRYGWPSRKELATAFDDWKGKKTIGLRDLLQIRAPSGDSDQLGPLLFKATKRSSQIRSAMAFLKHYYRFDFLRAKPVGEYHLHGYRNDEPHVSLSVSVPPALVFVHAPMHPSLLFALFSSVGSPLSPSYFCFCVTYAPTQTLNTMNMVPGEFCEAGADPASQYGQSHSNPQTRSYSSGEES